MLKKVQAVIKRLEEEAISLHLEGMLRDNDPIPPASHVAADFVEVDVES